MRVLAIERVARGSVLGCVLQPVLAVLSDPKVCTLQMAVTMQNNLSKLAHLSAQVGGVNEEVGHGHRGGGRVDGCFNDHIWT